MMFPDLAATVGKTPIVELKRMANGMLGRVAVKIESRNPLGSVKDRIGIAMVEAAEREGALGPGATLIEPTSGNTGIALACVAAQKGYRLILTMPETMSRERIALLRYLGAQVVLTPGSLMRAAKDRAVQLREQTQGSIMLDQFNNPANPEIHRQTTAVEIWSDTEGRIDVFVAGVGTGGTITGVGQVLKRNKPSIRVVAVEPARCAVLSGGRPNNHLIQGIGAGFVPAILDRGVVDEIIAVTDNDAFDCARRLAREEGIAAGISSGAALFAALSLAARPELAGRLIVVILADSGERYITTPLMEALAPKAT